MMDVFHNLDWSVLTDMLLAVLPALTCITLHELAHGLAAYRLGDDTAKRQGRLSLNPLKHIDLMGLLMMVVFRFGWAKPVPVNAYKFKHPKSGMALTALAGPVCNLLLAWVFLLLYGLCYRLFLGHAVGRIVLDLFYTTAYISTALAVFNILPIPPLDGSKVLFSFVPDRVFFRLMQFERYGMILLLLLVATGILGRPLAYCTQQVMDALFSIAQGAFQLTGRWS